jgi:hypothetical protein
MKWSNFAYDDSRTVIKKLDLEKTDAKSSRDENNWYYLDNKIKLRITMPNKHGGSGYLSTGFINQIIRALRLNKMELERRVDCSLSASRFEEMIREILNLDSNEH